jgi:hypothetical protein
MTLDNKHIIAFSNQGRVFASRDDGRTWSDQ